MSQTVSFVTRDELAEWLESRAEEEMQTVSSLVQDIVAQHYREHVETEKNGPSNVGGDESTGPANEGGNEDESETAFDRHPEKWYHPDSQNYGFAVYVPEEKRGAEHSNNQRYYKTRSGAESALERWYDE